MIAATLIGSLVWVAALVGWGDVVSRWLRLPDSGDVSGGEKGLLGLVAIGLLALLLHFFIPLSTPISLGVLGLGLLFCFRSPWVRETWKTPSLDRKLVPLLWVTGMLCTFLEMNLAYDYGYYHLPLIRAAQGAPLIPGYAHLFLAYGRPTPWFPMQALLSGGALGPNPPLFVGFLPWFFFFWMLMRQASTGSLPVGMAIAIGLLVNYLTSFNHSPDVPATYLGLAAWLSFLNAELGREPVRNHGYSLLFASFAAVLNLTAVPWLVLVIPLLLRYRSSRYRPFWRTAGLAFILGLLVVLRSLVLTGCPIYPTALGCVYPLPWALTPDALAAGLGDIKSWNGNPGDGWHRLAKLADFFQGRRFVWILLGGIGLAILAQAFPRRKCMSAAERNTLLTGLGLVLAMTAIWLVTLPASRFSFGYAVALVGLTTGLALTSFRLRFHPRLAVFLCLLACANQLRSSYHLNPHFGPREQPPALKTEVVQTFPHFKVVTPTGWRCFDSGLFCQPYPLRVKLLGEIAGRPVLGYNGEIYCDFFRKKCPGQK